MVAQETLPEVEQNFRTRIQFQMRRLPKERIASILEP
jgi:hypothetical protein